MAYVNKAKVNPCSPIIYLKIGDTTITTKNKPTQAQHIISLSLTESALDTYSDIVFTLYDDSALALEYELKRGFTRVEFRFGADETALSDLKVCHIDDYDIDFTGEGVTLTINCSMGSISSSDEKPKEYKGKISDVARAICKDLGYEEGNIVETNDTPKETGYSSAGTSLDALLHTLAKSAQSVDGDSGYVYYTKNQDGKTYMYFEPMLKRTVDDYGVYEFIIGQEHENIISFKPEYKGLLQYVVNNPPPPPSSTDSSTINNNPDNPTLGDPGTASGGTITSSTIGSASVTVDIIGKGKVIPGTSMTPTSITIHNTGNIGATAQNNHNYMRNLNKSGDRTASWHFTVDDSKVIQAIPYNQKAYHAGTASGNNSSIGIEICMFNDASRQKKCYDNAIALVKTLMSATGITSVKRHYDWSGKNCPAWLISGKFGYDWNWFYSQCTTSSSSEIGLWDLRRDKAEPRAKNIFSEWWDKLVNMNNNGGVTPPDLTQKSPMEGKSIYPRYDKLVVYTGTDSSKCKQVTTVAKGKQCIIYSETAMWYYIKTPNGKVGWVKKLDTTTITPQKEKEIKEEEKKKADESQTTTPPTNGITDTNYQNSEVVQKLGLKAPSVDELTNVLITPYESDTDFRRYVGSSSYNAEELGRIAEYMFTMASALQPTAQLELKGNALIDTQSFVVIVVLTKDKLFHHSSGLYQIIEIAHDIEMGNFTTTLNLLKRAMSIDEDGNIKLLDVSDGILSQNNKYTSSGTPSTTTNPSMDSADTATIKKYAEKYVGLPYVWGGSGPNKAGYDCSGFCSEMLYDMGYKRIGTTAEFIKCEPVIPWDKSQIQPGDCMVYRQNGKGHVVMIVDQNTIVHAPRTGDVIKYADIEYHWNYMQKKGGKIVRIIGNENYKRSDS